METCQEATCLTLLAILRLSKAEPEEREPQLQRLLKFHDDSEDLMKSSGSDDELHDNDGIEEKKITSVALNQMNLGR